uniref:HMG box domain-containing protein n=1 Tax=Acrobeloides nanus TaxID=290746 RepID=A0A914E4Y1_9BILA
MTSPENADKEMKAFESLVDHISLVHMKKNPFEPITRNQIIYELKKFWKDMEWEFKMQFLPKDGNAAEDSAFGSKDENLTDPLSFEKKFENAAKALAIETPIFEVKKARRKREDRNLPKHPISAYLYFHADNFAKVAAAHPEFKTGVYGEHMSLMNKTLKQLWDALSPEDRAKYEELGKKDKARYNAEMKELKERGTFTPLGLNRKPKSLHGEPVPKKTMNDQMIKLENAQAVLVMGGDLERQENLQPEQPFEPTPSSSNTTDLWLPSTSTWKAMKLPSVDNSNDSNKELEEMDVSARAHEFAALFFS